MKKVKIVVFALFCAFSTNNHAQNVNKIVEEEIEPGTLHHACVITIYNDKSANVDCIGSGSACAAAHHCFSW